MSTILKALRRLEEDRPAPSDSAAAGHEHRTAQDASKPFSATDPRAADELRARILAEEAAAHAVPGITARSSRASVGSGAADLDVGPGWAALTDTRGLLVMAVAVLSILGLSLGGYALLFGATSDPATSDRVASTDGSDPMALAAPGADAAARPPGASSAETSPSGSHDTSGARSARERSREPRVLAAAPVLISAHGSAAPSPRSPQSPAGLSTATVASEAADSASSAPSPSPSPSPSPAQEPEEPARRGGPMPLVAVVASSDGDSNGGSRSIPDSTVGSTPSAAKPKPRPRTATASRRESSPAEATSRAPAVAGTGAREAEGEPMPLGAVTPTSASAAATRSASTTAAAPAGVSPAATSAATPATTKAGASSVESSPTRASLTATDTASATAPRPKPTAAERSPANVSARAPSGSASTASTAGGRKTPAKPAPSSSPSSSPPPSSSASPSRDVERLDRRGLPDITVVRTSWHPAPERRSTKIRMEETEAVMSLKEGDAVGGFIIREISPSAVVFTTGDVEIRRRVGESGSSR